MPDKLPEEFAPTGPKLSRFPIQPAPPVRPHLFPDEARFALRLATMAGAAEAVAWIALARTDRAGACVLLALRFTKPLVARLGTRFPRPLVAGLLLAAALAGAVAGISWLAGVAVIADLCATCIADSVTIERRAAAYAWLDMGQGLGALAGFALAHWVGLPGAAALLALAFIGVRDLHDRGTPRSSWPARLYLSRSPLTAQLAILTLACGAAAFAPSRLAWLAAVGMAAASQLERAMPNAIWLPRIAVLVAAAGFVWPPLWPVALGMMFAVVPAAVARGAGEMERPLVSSLAWSALFAGAAIRVVLS